MKIIKIIRRVKSCGDYREYAITFTDAVECSEFTNEEYLELKKIHISMEYNLLTMGYYRLAQVNDPLLNISYIILYNMGFERNKDSIYDYITNTFVAEYIREINLNELLK